MSAIETCRTAALGGRRALRGLRARAHRLQFLPQPPLPQVPGRRGATMARRPHEAFELLPVPYYRRLHPAGRDRAPSRSRTRPPSTTSCSRTPPGPLTTCAADPKHLGARVGLAADALRTRARRSPTIPTSTSSRPAAACRRTRRAGSPVSPASSCPLRVLSASLPPSSFSKASHRAQPGRPPGLPGDLAPLSPRKAPSTPRSRRCAAPIGSSTPSGPSPDRKTVLAYLARYAPTASPSPTPGSSRSTTRAITFKWKDYRIKGRDRLQDHDARPRRVHPPLSPTRPARAASTASAITASSPAAVRAHNIERDFRQLLTASRSRAKSRARRGRQRDRNTSDRPPMPMLRRPDDHHQYVSRARAPAQSPSPARIQNRHLMTRKPRISPRNLDRFPAFQPPRRAHKSA